MNPEETMFHGDVDDDDSDDDYYDDDDDVDNDVDDDVDEEDKAAAEVEEEEMVPSTEKVVPSTKKVVPWTSDGKAPYIFWHVNSHGSMNDIKKPHVHEVKQTDMDIRAYSIAGNQNQCGWAAILKKDIPPDSEYYEYRDKAIDFCIPSVERSVWYDRKNKSTDLDLAYNSTIQKVKNLYFLTNTFTRLQEKGGFEVMVNPNLYHEYQLHGNEGENTRPDSRKKLPKRAAAGDIKISDIMIYGVWVVCTNIKVLEPLALTSIDDDELGSVKENKGRKSNHHLFLPPELMNRLNMASRQYRKPLGATYWMKAIDALMSYDLTTDQTLRRLRIRARTALENLWKTRKTNSHDIIDIFEPFNKTGQSLGCPALKLFTIDGSCRSNIGEIYPPDPDKQLVDTTIEDSINFYDGNRESEYVPPEKSKRKRQPRKVDDGNREHVDVPPEKSKKKRQPWKGGGTKRKYSRKRRTPTRRGIRFTRRRRTRY